MDGVTTSWLFIGAVTMGVTGFTGAPRSGVFTAGVVAVEEGAGFGTGVRVGGSLVGPVTMVVIGPDD